MANKTAIGQLMVPIKTETKMIFKDTTGFRAAIIKIFRDIEEERIAEKNL